ncbi:MAG TPA: hypothetical protein VGO11_09150 [Chthoniobacteraceae bacterium]|jgi:hypothetical protein|nr:hypothetical protein [Chthoniobacteraceae bacterium]
MPQSSDAEEHLRIIRSLMEKATIYRAISAQAALIGGVLAGLAGGLLAGRNDPFVKALSSSMLSANAEVYGFQLKWLVVLLLCIGVNLFFLQRDAKRRGEPFVSPGMRAALNAMGPALFTGAVVTSLWARDFLPQMWMIFYGLAILSTGHFAPKSLIRLGWAFLFTGLILAIVNGETYMGLREHLPDSNPQEPPAWTYPDTLMARIFGGYHIIYALRTLRRAPATVAPPAA